MIGWGVVGASNIAREWMIPAVNAQPDSRVVGVAGGDPQRVAAYAAAQGVPAAGSLAALLADPAVDVVYVSSTNEQHHAQAMAAIAAGKHVLCEKPLALRLEDAREMVAAAAAAGVVFGTNHHLRNSVVHRALRRLVADGAIGQPLSARVFHAVYLPPRLQGWRVTRPDGGGVVLDITVHDADTLRFVLRAEAVAATAMTGNQGMASGGLEDAVMAVLRFDNGMMVQLHDAFTHRHALTGFEVHGSEGSLYARNAMTQQAVGSVVLRRDDTEEAVGLDEPENLYERAVRNFNAAVRGEGAPSASGEDGVRSLAIALAVREAAATGRQVAVASA